MKQIVEKVAEKVTDAATADSGMEAHSTGGACAPYDLFKNKSDGCIRVALRP